MTELNQEIGLNVRISDLTPGDIHKYDGGTNREFVKLYFYTFKGNISDLKFNDGEVAEVKWMLPEDIVNAAKENPDGWVKSADKILEIINS